MPNRRIVYSAQVTSLRLNQTALQPKFDLENATRIYTSICNVMFYYYGGDSKYEYSLITWFVNRERSEICSNPHSTPIRFSILWKKITVQCSMRIWPTNLTTSYKIDPKIYFPAETESPKWHILYPNIYGSYLLPDTARQWCLGRTW